MEWMRLKRIVRTGDRRDGVQILVDRLWPGGASKAAVAHLIPTDGLDPGATEAGVTFSIDRQMAGAFSRAETWYMQIHIAMRMPPKFQVAFLAHA
jgi:uncharacterized protein YeaO (DUF488 family)